MFSSTVCPSVLLCLGSTHSHVHTHTAWCHRFSHQWVFVFSWTRQRTHTHHYYVFIDLLLLLMFRLPNASLLIHYWCFCVYFGCLLEICTFLWWLLKWAFFQNPPGIFWISPAQSASARFFILYFLCFHTNRWSDKSWKYLRPAEAAPNQNKQQTIPLCHSAPSSVSLFWRLTELLLNANTSSQTHFTATINRDKNGKLQPLSRFTDLRVEKNNRKRKKKSELWDMGPNSEEKSKRSQIWEKKSIFL